VCAADRISAQRSAEELIGAGVPPDFAAQISQLDSLLPVLDLVEVAAATGRTLDEAFAVYFAVDDRLELHALRERIRALPRQERWEALARRALWEDLQSEHRSLTADILDESANGDVTERVSAWLEHNAGAVGRTEQVLADVKAGNAPDLATLSVAVREIRNLIEATAAPTVTPADRAAEAVVRSPT
jgi:glutamate dehydrogenase